MYAVEYNWDTDTKVQKAKDYIVQLIKHKIPFEVSYVQRVKSNVITITTRDKFKVTVLST